MMSDFITVENPRVCLACGKESGEPLHQVRWLRFCNDKSRSYGLAAFPLPMCKTCRDTERRAIDGLIVAGYEERSDEWEKRFARDAKSDGVKKKGKGAKG